MEFIISTACSGISSFATYPIDVVKSQYQVSRMNYGKDIGVRSIVGLVVQKQGYRGFTRGVSSHLMTYPMFWGIYFQTRGYNLTPFGVPYMDKVFMAIGSGIVGRVFTNPLFVLKIRKQTEALRGGSTGYGTLIKNIYRHEGFSGFMKGVVATCASNVKLGLQFPMYDYLRDTTDSAFVASFGSKLVTSAVFYPFDLVRTIQRDAVDKKSMWSVFRDTMREGGVRGLYRGVGLYTMVTGPNFILMLVLQDWARKWFNK